LDIYEIRKLGKEFCETEGSAHYKGGNVEPIDLIISKGLGKDFCIANIIKYATRFKNTGNLEDVKKAVDYGHILAGIELDKLQTDRGKITSDGAKVPKQMQNCQTCGNLNPEDSAEKPGCKLPNAFSCYRDGYKNWIPKQAKSCSNCDHRQYGVCHYTKFIEEQCKANNLSRWREIGSLDY